MGLKVRNNFRKQSGAALLIMMLALILTASIFIVKRFDSQSVEVGRDKKTAAALAEAKKVLIQFAAFNSNYPGSLGYPGSLPCPDINNDGKGDRYDAKGNSISNGTECISGYVGRLPWEDLNTVVFKDGAGECLWYALSPIYRNTLPINRRSKIKLNALNVKTLGELKVYDEQFNLLNSDVVAIIFAPNSKLINQYRKAKNAGCGEAESSQYLDKIINGNSAIDNSTGKFDAIPHSFIVSKSTNYFNDKLIVITRTELWNISLLGVKKNISGEYLNDNGYLRGSGLMHFYHKEGGKLRYPYADNGDIDFLENDSLLNGELPIDELSFSSDVRKWIINNDWLSVLKYSVNNSAQDFNLSF